MSSYIDSQPNACGICANPAGELRDSGECYLQNGEWRHCGTIFAWCPKCGVTHEMQYAGEQYRVSIYDVLDNPVK